MKIRLLILLGFLGLIMGNSFAQDTTKAKQVAPEFSRFKGILLVVRNKTFRDNTLNNMTEKRFEKHYKGEYEIIDEDELTGKGFADSKKYRFTVQLQVSRTVIRGGSANGTANDNSKFVMVDRVTGERFESRDYTNWVRAMNQYINALEEARNKEQD